MSAGGWQGTGALLRLALRRDRVRLPVWVSVFVLLVASSASATVKVYPDVASRIAAATSINSTPALVALYGRIYDPRALGAVSMIKMVAFGAALLAVLTANMVVRHTRTAEESGYLELLGATVVGRRAALASALILSGAVSLTIGVLSGVSLFAAGLPVAGSFAFGLSWAGTGAAFAAVAAVTAQLSRAARTATALATGTLGLAYVLRAFGDTGGPGLAWLSWLSPVGWGQQVRAYAGDRWWVLLLPAAFAVVVGGLAFWLADRRDMGAGLLADRPGPQQASPRLASPLALTVRLQRGVTAGWLVAFALLGVVMGNIAANVGSFLDSPAAKEFIQLLGGQRGLTDAFIATELSIMSIVCSVYGIQVVLRARAEETGGRADAILATGTPRLRWYGGHLAVAVAGMVLLTTVGGLTGGAAHAASTGRSGDVWRVLGAALCYLPASLVMVAVAAVLVGWLPRWAGSLSWAALVAVLMLGQVGALLKLPTLALDLSPFSHVPRLPGASLQLTPLLWLAAVVVVGFAAGLAGMRRRDIS